MSEDSPPVEIEQLLAIGQRLLAEHHVVESALGGRMPDDHRDTANLMLALRGVEFTFAATDDFFHNRPAAGAAMGRSILETALLLRWCLLSAANAKLWWREGDAAIQKSLRTLGLSSAPEVVAVRDRKAIGIGLPGYPRMAKDTDMTGPYSRWYSTLSAYAHGSRMSTAHSYTRTGHPPPPPPVHPCIYFANDIGTVFHGWSAERRLPPPWPHP